jgi:nucleoside-diphosphate-sugar epimerase
MAEDSSILVTGADGTLGASLARYLDQLGMTVLATGRAPAPALAQLKQNYRQVDPRSEEEVDQALCDARTILHAQPLVEAEDDALRLEIASLGTFRLLQGARGLGAGRMILLSSLRMFDAYPEKYVIDEMWKPQPNTTAQCLAPYYAELVSREFARQGPPHTFCLRIDPREGHPEDIQSAVQAALKAQTDPLGYRWKVIHISRSGRFNTRSARLELNWQPRREGV